MHSFLVDLMPKFAISRENSTVFVRFLELEQDRMKTFEAYHNLLTLNHARSCIISREYYFGWIRNALHSLPKSSLVLFHSLRVMPRGNSLSEGS